MATITLPEPIKLGPEPKEGEEDERETFGLPELLMWLVNNDYRFNSEGKGIRVGARVEPAVEKAKESGELELLLDDLKFVNDCLECPKHRVYTPTGAEVVDIGYPIMPARKIVKLIDAVKKSLPKS